MKKQDIVTLVVAILSCETVGVMASYFIQPAMPTWYPWIPKPPLTPPAWSFSLVWSILYALMGLSLYLVWKVWLKNKNAKAALELFLLQLALNLLWTILFFGMQNIFAAMIEIVFLWVAILATTIAFYRFSRPAAWLLVPYLLWVGFAAYLNSAIWELSVSAPQPQPWHHEIRWSTTTVTAP